MHCEKKKRFQGWTVPLSVICEVVFDGVVKGRKLHTDECVGAGCQKEHGSLLVASCDAQEFMVVVLYSGCSSFRCEHGTSRSSLATGKIDDASSEP